MPKRLVICCDGTWDTPDEPESTKKKRQGAPTPVLSTNVAKLAQAIADKDGAGIEQRLFYNRGVGTSHWDHWLGGAVGWGLSHHIQQCYRFLVEWFEPGDELFLFGFSRGAYTARSLAGFIRNSGILKREEARRLADAYDLYRRRDSSSHPDAIESQLFRRSFSRETRIRFIGVWDTVGALGIPFAWAGWLNRRWRFHDVQLSSRVDYAYHAIAIDERRRWFRPTLWQQQHKPESVGQVMEQVWFAGVHRNVGGGAKEGHGLSDITLRWMKVKAKACGLTFDEATFDEVCPLNPSDWKDRMENSKTSIYRLVPDYHRCIGPDCIDKDTHKKRDGTSNEIVHPAAKKLYDDPDHGYHPKNLKDYLDAGGLVSAGQ